MTSDKDVLELITKYLECKRVISTLQEYFKGDWVLEVRMIYSSPIFMDFQSEYLYIVLYNTQTDNKIIVCCSSDIDSCDISELEAKITEKIKSTVDELIKGLPKLQ